jgi:hypothetical protein
MNYFSKIARRLLVAAVALAMLALPAVASASKRDRNHDGVPDRWAAKHGLSGKKAAKGDPDRDGLNNRAEYRSMTHPRRADSDGDGTGDAGEDRDRDEVDNGNEARERTHPRRRDSDRDGTSDGSEDADEDRLDNSGEDDAGTDPIDPDSDEDGIKDGDEGAGTIVSFEDGVLTLRLYGGATLSGTVDEVTFIDCEDAGSKDEPTDVDTGDGGETDDSGLDGADDFKLARNDGDDYEDDYYDDEEGSGGCSVDVLLAGTRVDQALVSLTLDGPVFEEIVLGR